MLAQIAPSRNRAARPNARSTLAVNMKTTAAPSDMQKTRNSVGRSTSWSRSKAPIPPPVAAPTAPPKSAPKPITAAAGIPTPEPIATMPIPPTSEAAYPPAAAPPAAPPNIQPPEPCLTRAASHSREKIRRARSMILFRRVKIMIFSNDLFNTLEPLSLRKTE